MRRLTERERSARILGYYRNKRGQWYSPRDRRVQAATVARAGARVSFPPSLSWLPAAKARRVFREIIIPEVRVFVPPSLAWLPDAEIRRIVREASIPSGVREITIEEASREVTVARPIREVTISEGEDEEEEEEIEEEERAEEPEEALPEIEGGIVTTFHGPAPDFPSSDPFYNLIPIAERFALETDGSIEIHADVRAVDVMFGEPMIKSEVLALMHKLRPSNAELRAFGSLHIGLHTHVESDFEDEEVEDWVPLFKATHGRQEWDRSIWSLDNHYAGIFLAAYGITFRAFVETR